MVTNLTSKFVCVFLELIGFVVRYMLLGQIESIFVVFCIGLRRQLLEKKFPLTSCNVHVSSFGSYKKCNLKILWLLMESYG